MSGFEQPNYTQAPNAFFDRVLKSIDSMSELKVTLAVIRHTMGFHRDEHELSLSYLVEYTGMRRETVIDGLKRAMKRGTVGRRESGNTFAYFMKVVGKPDQAGSRKTGPKVVGKPDPRKKEKESITPTGEVKPSLTRKNSGQTPEANDYYIAYLYNQLDERELLEASPITSDYKGKLAGHLTAHKNKGARHARILFTLDRIRSEWTRRRLPFTEAWDDTQPDNVRHLRPVSGPSEQMVSTAGYRSFE